jgi:hypothetical protein
VYSQKGTMKVISPRHSLVRVADENEMKREWDKTVEQGEDVKNAMILS